MEEVNYDLSNLYNENFEFNYRNNCLPFWNKIKILLCAKRYCHRDAIIEP